MSCRVSGSGVHRRQILQGAAVAAASGWIGSSAHAQAARQSAVVFLSRSSNTGMLAGHLSRTFGADLIAIRPREPWPADYEEMVAWASRWRESDDLLPLDAVPDLSGRATVFLGFPIWGMSLPAPMRSFLSSVDLPGKTVLPFITHGGYGPGDAIAEVRRLAPDAEFAEPFVLECDQERSNLNALGAWLSNVAASIPR